MAALTTRAIPTVRRVSALYCATYGSGTPLLLIHNTLADSSGQEFAPLVAALSASHLVIVPDLRGYGLSRRLTPSSDPVRLAADLDNLLDLLHIPSAYVLGYQGGTVIARQFAQRYASRVRGLILIAPRDERGRGARVAGSLWRGLSRVVGAADGQVTQSRLGLLADHTVAPCSPSTLLICGGATPLPLRPQEIARQLPRAQLQIIPNGGTQLLNTHSSAVAQAILPWIAQREVRA